MVTGYPKSTQIWVELFILIILEDFDKLEKVVDYPKICNTIMGIQFLK